MLELLNLLILACYFLLQFLLSAHELVYLLNMPADLLLLHLEHAIQFLHAVLRVLQFELHLTLLELNVVNLLVELPHDQLEVIHLFLKPRKLLLAAISHEVQIQKLRLGLLSRLDSWTCKFGVQQLGHLLDDLGLVRF